MEEKGEKGMRKERWTDWRQVRRGKVGEEGEGEGRGREGEEGKGREGEREKERRE